MRTVLLFLLLFLSISVSAENSNPRVEIFQAGGEQFHQVPNKARIFNLSVPIEADYFIVKTVEEKGIITEEDPKFQRAIKEMHYTYPAQEISDNWLGLLLMYQYKLTHLPAIVFDKRAVIYGERDVSKALAIYTLRYKP